MNVPKLGALVPILGLLAACASPERKCYSPAAETAKQIALTNWGTGKKADTALVDCTGTVWRVRGKVER